MRYELAKMILLMLTLGLTGCPRHHAGTSSLGGTKTPPPLTAEMAARPVYVQAVKAVDDANFKLAFNCYERMNQQMRPDQVPAELMAGYTRCMIELGDYRTALAEIRRYGSTFRLSEPLKENQKRAQTIADTVRKYSPRGTNAPPEAFDKAIAAHRNDFALWRDLIHAYRYLAPNARSMQLSFQLDMLELPAHPEREEAMDQMMLQMANNPNEMANHTLILAHAVEGLEKGKWQYHRAQLKLVSHQMAIYHWPTPDKAMPNACQALISYGDALEMLTSPEGWAADRISWLIRDAREAAELEPTNPRYARLLAQVEKNQDAIRKERYATNDRWDAQNRSADERSKSEFLNAFKLGVAIGATLSALSPPLPDGWETCPTCGGYGHVYDANHVSVFGPDPTLCPECKGQRVVRKR